MTQRKNIVIHQALHGYREGHTLLASSISFGSTELRDLLMLSDYSGSGTEKGFKEYLTGYPLSNSKWYAFAKTWYADEMSRPGCVWTHTLLIDVADLWQIRDLSRLVPFFDRPTAGGSQEMYGHTLEILSDDVDFPLLTPSYYKLASIFYSFPKAIVLSQESSIENEDEILALWSFQWPKLKRHFTFCTGSLSLRHISKKPFQIQVVPQKRINSISAADKEKLNIIPEFENAISLSWEGLFARYRNENPASVLHFMTKVGADLNESKSNFTILLEAYFLQSNLTIEGVFEFLTTNYNLPIQGQLLKRHLVESLWFKGRETSFDKIDNIFLNADVLGNNWNYLELLGLGLNSNQLEYDDVLTLLQKFPQIFRNDPRVVELLQSMPISYWLQYTGVYEDFIDHLIERNQSLLYSEYIWTADKEIQIAWFRNALKGNPDYRRLVWVQLDVNNGIFAQQICEVTEGKALQYSLEWIESRDQDLQVDWQFLIKTYIGKSFEYFSSLESYNRSLLRLYPRISSPSAYEWKFIENGQIVETLDRLEDIGSSTEISAFYTFFLCSVISDTLLVKKVVLERVFQPLHDLLGRNIVDVPLWNRLQALTGTEMYDLVEMDFFSAIFGERLVVPEWDRCEYLRRVLLCGVINHNWDSIWLVSIVKDAKTFENLVEFCMQAKPLKKVMKELFKKISNQKLDTFHYKLLAQKFS